MGAHWAKMNVGLYDTRLLGLHIVDDDGPGDHVLAGTPYGNFDIILDHLSGMSGLFTIPHTPCTALYLVTMLIGC